RADGYRLPVRDAPGGALAVKPKHRALGLQRLDRGHAQLGGLLDQRVHALVGGHAQRDLEVERQLAIHGLVLAHAHVHVALAHARHLRPPPWPPPPPRHSPPAPSNSLRSSPGCSRRTWTWRAASSGRPNSRPADK